MHPEQSVPVLLMAQELGQGGSERQLVEVAKALDPKRFEVHVGCLRATGFRNAELMARGIPVVHIPVYSFKSPGVLRGAWQLSRFLRRRRIRLVHTFDTPMNCFAVPVARASGVPVVLSSQRASRRLCSGWEQSVLRFTDRLADAVVVNCAAIERHMVDEEGVRPDHLRICYNGLDTERFEPLPKRHPAALAGASLVIGVVCALRPEKDLPTLIEAMAKLVSRASPAVDAERMAGLRLVIVGSGGMLGTLREMSIKLGIEERCHFEPSVADVGPWLQAIDVFVLPSKSEALSNSLMEAMACGCAVVASRVGGNPELVTDSVSGLLFEAGNPDELAERLERLIADDTLRSQVAAAGSAKMRQKFRLQDSVARMQEIYQEFLSRKLARA